MNLSTTAIKIPSVITLAPTPGDRDRGVCNSPTKCMFVYPAQRIFPGARITVNPHRLTVSIGGEYHHYGMPRKGVFNVAMYDKRGKAMTDAEVKKAVITLHLIGTKKASYKGTKVEKERHRLNSAKRRATPGYIRPDSSRATIRSQLAHTYKIKKLEKELVL